MKTIFVSGAASGIGRATSLLFAKRGWLVGCYDVDVDGARRTAEEAGARGRHGRLDVTNAESWTTAVADFEASRSTDRRLESGAVGGGAPDDEAASPGALDVLFNSAGILRMGSFDDISAEECRKQLDVNVMGVVLGIQSCLPLLTRARGRIITMSSASAIYGQPELAVYSASKFAVRAITEALDIELRDRGVTICDVMPSYVDTPMVRSQTHRAKSLEKMGVKLSADDVAEVVWKAAHGDRLHYVPQTNIQVMSRLGGLVPELGRAVMRRLARA